MKQKVYLINKVFVNEGLTEPEAEVFSTKEKRDKAWNELIHSHNNMVMDCFGIDLDNIPDDYFYDWNDEFLEFYCISDPDMHHDYFTKSGDAIEVDNETC